MTSPYLHEIPFTEFRISGQNKLRSPYEKYFDGRDLSKTQRVQCNKTSSIIALANSAMERIPLHSWEMEFSIQYHVTINSQLNDQNSIRYYIILS